MGYTVLLNWPLDISCRIYYFLVSDKETYTIEGGMPHFGKEPLGRLGGATRVLACGILVRVTQPQSSLIIKVVH